MDESNLIDVTFSIPDYRRSCIDWYEDKTPDTIADVLGMAPFATRMMRGNNQFKEIERLKQEIKNLQEQLISKQEENTHHPTDEIQAVLDSIKAYHQEKKRYPKSIKCIKVYFNDDEWQLVSGISKERFKELLDYYKKNLK